VNSILVAAWAKERQEEHDECMKSGEIAMGIQFGMPKLTDFLGMRSMGESHYDFLDRFVRAVVGAGKYDSMSASHNLSNFVCVGDEAFALLVYENQEDRWWEMHTTGSTKSAKQAKFTDGGKSSRQSGRSRLGKGWDNAGIKRFNQLCKMVHNDRVSAHAKSFEKEYQQHRLELKEEKQRGSKAKAVTSFPGDETAPDEVFHEMGGCMVLENFEDEAEMMV